MSLKLNFGDSVAGLLVDGVSGTPFVGATLTLSDPQGVRVIVPYILHDESGQFTGVERWFRSKDPPSNLIFATSDGNATLFETAWAGHSEQHIGTGTLAPSEVVLWERDGDLTDPLTVEAVYSHIDGLNEWCEKSAIDTGYETDAHGKVNRLSISVESSELLTWRQGASTLSLLSTWKTERASGEHGRSISVLDNIALQSVFTDGPRSFRDHLAEQNKVASLVTLVYGTHARFRRHDVRDARFAEKSYAGQVFNHPFVELLSRHTIRDRIRPAPKPEEFRQPLAPLSEIGASGFTRWSDEYVRWKRFILPAVGSFRRRDAYLEDAVISTCMAMEAASQLIGSRPDESTTYRGGRCTIATHVYRCLDVINFSFSDAIESRAGLAQAIADNYNSIKHADRGDFPDYAQTYIVSEISSLVVRLLALWITRSAKESLERVASGEGLWRERRLLDDNGLRIRRDGTWEATAGV